MKRYIKLGFVAVFVLAGTAAVSVLRDRSEAGVHDSGLSIVVDLSERVLEIRIDGEVHGSYDVAVGQPGHRTPAGAYRLSEVIWNPGWVPPDSEWAEDATRKAPGDPDNPMGRVKIFFDDLLYIHGTDETQTLGEPASHGCIRMRNEDVMMLGRLVMEYGGAARDEHWYEAARSHPTTTREVAIPEPPRLDILD